MEDKQKVDSHAVALKRCSLYTLNHVRLYQNNLLLLIYLLTYIKYDTYNKILIN